MKEEIAEFKKLTVLLFCQPIVTVTLWFAYNAIARSSDLSIRVSSVECTRLYFLLNCKQNITSLSLLVGTTVYSRVIASEPLRQPVTN